MVKLLLSKHMHILIAHLIDNTYDKHGNTYIMTLVKL